MSDLISEKELNPHDYELSPEQEVNFNKLYCAMNDIRDKYGVPMIIDSGVRSPADQLRINPFHMNDAHTKAAAVDVLDADGKLWNWCMANLDFLAELGIYLEAKNFCVNWVHFQIYAPGSGKRIFIP